MVRTSQVFRPIRRYLYSMIPPRAPVSTVFGVAGRVFLTQIDIPYTVEIDQIIYQVAAASLGNVRVAIYAEGGADIPDGGELMVESASVAQDAANRMQMIQIAQTQLPAGRYWIAIQGSNIGGSYHAMNSGTSATEIGRAYYNLGAYGAFTDPCPVTTQDDGARHNRMFVRVVE